MGVAHAHHAPQPPNVSREGRGNRQPLNPRTRCFSRPQVSSRHAVYDPRTRVYVQQAAEARGVYAPSKKFATPGPNAYNTAQDVKTTRTRIVGVFSSKTKRPAPSSMLVNKPELVPGKLRACPSPTCAHAPRAQGACAPSHGPMILPAAVAPSPACELRPAQGYAFPLSLVWACLTMVWRPPPRLVLPAGPGDYNTGGFADRVRQDSKASAAMRCKSERFKQGKPTAPPPGAYDPMVSQTKTRAPYVPLFPAPPLRATATAAVLPFAVAMRLCRAVPPCAPARLHNNNMRNTTHNHTNNHGSLAAAAV